MDDEPLETVDELLRLPLLSRDLLRVIETMGPSLSDEPVADVSSFMASVLRAGRENRQSSAGLLFQELERMNGQGALSTALRPSVAVQFDLRLSPGLRLAIRDAFDIRRQTGGKDDWIGVRHAIMAILTSRDPLVDRERSTASRLIARLDAPSLVETFVSNVIVSATEENESLNIWADILSMRKFGKAAFDLMEASRRRENRHSPRGVDNLEASVERYPEADDPWSNKGRASESPFSLERSLEDPAYPREFAAVGSPVAGTDSLVGGVTIDAPVAPEPDDSGLHKRGASGVGTDRRLSVTPQRNAIAGIRNDDPSALSDAEMVGDDGAARALARVIASKGFQPPLAVGVFGAWGSGKSFLMGRVRQEIRRLKGSDASVFHTDIAEVTFNAWHYVDTDLWANLVGQIFETLEQHINPVADRGGGLLDKLTTARELTVASARDLASKRQVAQQAQAQLQTAEQEQSARRKTLATKIKAAGAAAIMGLDVVKTDTDASWLINATYGRSVEAMAAEWREPEVALEAMRRDGLVVLQVRRQLGLKRFLWACGVTGFLVAAAPLLFVLVNAGWDGLMEFSARLSPLALFATGILSTAAGGTAVVARKAVVARDTVVKALAAYREATDDAANTVDVQKDQAAVEAADIRVREAQAALDAAIDSQAQAAGALARSTPIERLKAFVAEKASRNGAYRSRQGLIGTIRRDFADLAALMADGDDEGRIALGKANAALEGDIERLQEEFPGGLTEADLTNVRGPSQPATEAPKFQRIILYIDDLDRCPADKIVEVLQAVHLLMAFRLFVVVVAVDVRWLQGALAKHYVQFGETEDRPATIEYLEKIFQLAVWTQPLEDHDSGTFIRGRLASAGRLSSPGSGSGDVHSDQESRAGADGDEDEIGREPGADLLSEADPLDPQFPTLDVGPGLDNEALSVTGQEVAWLEDICRPLAMTPRRLLRLLNSYQVARASLSESGGARFNAGGYRAFAPLLAAVVAWPECAPLLISEISHAGDWSQVTTAVKGDCPASLLGRIEAWCALLDAEAISVTETRPYIDLALRFSFVESKSLARANPELR